MKLGFVCTNYNNSSFTRGAVESLARGGRWADVRVVIVDNRSREEDIAALQALARQHPRVELILNSDNSGYFPGLNLGIRHLRAKFPDLAHMVIGNNDLVFPCDFVETVERHQDALERWAVVAPDLVTPDGVHQNPHVLHRVGRLRKAAWNLYFLSYTSAEVLKLGVRVAGRFAVRGENRTDSELFRTAGPIEQGYGACYLLGPTFFRHFTELYAPTFMLQEEFFLSEQLKLISQSTYYEPGIVVQHHGHASTKQIPTRKAWEMGHRAHHAYKAYLRLAPEDRRRAIAARTMVPSPAAG